LLLYFSGLLKNSMKSMFHWIIYINFSEAFIPRLVRFTPGHCFCKYQNINRKYKLESSDSWDVEYKKWEISWRHTTSNSEKNILNSVLYWIIICQLHRLNSIIWWWWMPEGYFAM
jgi:hypothetical protein